MAKKYLTIVLFSFLMIYSQDIPSSDSLYFGEITISSDTIPSDFQKLFDTYYSSKLTQESYNNFVSRILGELESKGYYFSVLELINSDIQTSNDSIYFNPEFQLNLKQKAKIDTIIYQGLSNTDPEFVNRKLSQYKNRSINKTLIKNITHVIRHIDFLELKGEEEIVKTTEGEYGLLLNLEDRKTNNIRGIAGYVPKNKTSGEGYFTGQVHYSLVNPGGWGKKFELEWSRPNKTSQQLQANFYAPWIFNTDFSINLNFDQVYRDTLMVNRHLTFTTERQISSQTSFNINYRYRSSLPIQTKNSLDLTSSQGNYFGIGIKRDNRDYQYNPTQGGISSLQLFLGKTQESIIKELLFNASYNLLLNNNLVLNSELTTKTKWFSNTNQKYGEYYWFGGATSMRGYPEDFFHSTKVGWSTIELRWIRGRLSRIYTFFEQGFYKKPDDTKYDYPFSYGIGLQLNSRMGIIGIDYAFDENDTFSTAKIHLHLVTRF